jgi:D-alanyl-D-alanine carboxypeptidase (penicillin-binding protein 5/6)
MSERASSAVDFISWGFAGFSKIPVLKSGASAGNAPVEGGAEPQVSLVAPRDLFIVVPKGAAGNQTRRMVLDKPVVAPVAKGQKLGSLIVSVPGRGETRLPLVAGAAVEEAGPLLRGWNWLKGLFGA